MYVAGGLEEVTSTGASSTLTKYFGAASLPTAERVGTNGPLAYLATDGQGTVSETLDGSGAVTSAQLYTPYGNVRYSSGSSPTSLGYTGQRADSATGLDYYNARYYDPAAGQFASADSVDDGLNRYGYVRGNPTTATDPSGHRLAATVDFGCGTCDFTVNNVTVVHEGCANPDLGCSYADATRAVVGPGKLQQKGTDNNPTIYKYGTDQNGALLTGFQGKVLDHLIQTMEDLREGWQRFLDWDTQHGEQAIDVASAVLAFATQVATCVKTDFAKCPFFDPEEPEEFDQLHEWWDSNLSALEALATVVAQANVNDYNASITALKGAASQGQTVWYRQMMWLGHNVSQHSQAIGGSSFITGWGDQPPPDALYAIGDSMRAQCAGYPSSPWGNSPGVGASQDSTYPGSGPCN